MSSSAAAMAELERCLQTTLQPHAARTCEDDRCSQQDTAIWYCVDCDSSFCSACWPRQGAHRPHKKGRDGMPHEPMDPDTVTCMGSILDTTRSLDDVKRMLILNAFTKWFGVVRRPSNRLDLLEFNRYAALMLNSRLARDPTECFPRLVAFIGATNAGKSTIIRMLIESHNGSRRLGSNQFPSPVVGSAANDTVPTSGDVHLYADPVTHATRTPALYIDCEGFEAGERAPLGSRSLESFSTHPDSLEHLGLGAPAIWPVRGSHAASVSGREHTVTAFYPRLLYTVSDCVVFVLRNPKTFQSAVLSKLIDWGVKAFEQSLNSPGLPHCIVVLNASPPGLPPNQWDIKTATRDLLATATGVLDGETGVPRLCELARQWRARGKETATVEQLILHYYASFTAIRVPTGPSYMRIRQQISELHSTIQRKCATSFESRRRHNTLTNALEMKAILSRAFAHFTTTPTQPFDFGQVSLEQCPVPVGFKAHIVSFCSMLTSQQIRPTRAWAEWMFEKLSVLLASCVVLDSARARKGRRLQLFVDYEASFEQAMTEYFERIYPCAFADARGNRRCVVVRASHSIVKGHRDAKGVIADGSYQSDIDASFALRWKAQLKTAIDELRAAFQDALHPSLRDTKCNNFESDTAAMLHAKRLDRFYDTMGPASNCYSNTVGLCCLMEDHPPNALPCGHMICDSCVKTFGTERPIEDAFELRGCPLHLSQTQWPQPVVIRYQPLECRARVLALEGGGLMAIVQLEALQMIEELTGASITSLFDLIVGEGTGGLVAALLSCQGKKLSDCINAFVDVCVDAYTAVPDATPLVSHIVRKITDGVGAREAKLYHALRQALTSEQPFCDPPNASGAGCRIAVIAKKRSGRQTLLANYHRKQHVDDGYDFERPARLGQALRRWQCAAATMSQSDQFHPFRCDEATYRAGPDRDSTPFVIAHREAERLWPRTGGLDCLLSLGTGHDADALRATIMSEKSHADAPRQSSLHARAGHGTHGRAKSDKSHDRSGMVARERAWQELRRHESRDAPYVRLNPDLGRVTLSADYASSIQGLRIMVRRKLREVPNLACLQVVAHRLSAARFFFRRDDQALDASGRRVHAGRILCRSAPGTEETRALGRTLLRLQGDSFQPFFAVRPRQEPMQSHVPITADDAHAMIGGRTPCQWPILITAEDDRLVAITLTFSPHDPLQPEGYNISGFPRALVPPLDPCAQSSASGAIASAVPGAAVPPVAPSTRQPEPNRNASTSDSISSRSSRSVSTVASSADAGDVACVVGSPTHLPMPSQLEYAAPLRPQSDLASQGDNALSRTNITRLRTLA